MIDNSIALSGGVNEKMNKAKLLGFGVMTGLLAPIYPSLASGSYYAVNYLDKGDFANSAFSSEPSLFDCLIGGMENFEFSRNFMNIRFGQTYASCFAVCGCFILAIGYMFWRDRPLLIGKEQGSARWFAESERKAYNRHFTDVHDYNNLILGDKTRLSLNPRAIAPAYQRTGMCILFGGSGSGKTLFYVKPNLLQQAGTYIMTDPSGDVFNDFAPYFIHLGYPVYCLNVLDMDNSNYYNPLDYVYSPNGEIDNNKVDVLVSLYMENANEGKEQGSSDPFWEKAEIAFLTGVIYYVLENPHYKADFPTVLELVQKSRVEDRQPETELTREIRRFCEANPDNQTWKYYANFLLAPAKTANTILITTVTDLKTFANPNIARLTAKTDSQKKIPFERLAEQPCYLFLCIPPVNEAYNFLISMFYSQLFNVLYDRGSIAYRTMYRLKTDKNNAICYCFDTKAEAEDFKKNVCKDNIEFESPYYVIRYNGKIYAKSYIREALIKMIDEIKTECTVDHACPSESELLPTKIIFLLDEIKNVGKIPKLENVLNTGRKYRINISAIYQNVAQAKEMYGENYLQFVGGFDTLLFYGASAGDDDTKEFISKQLGETTQMTKSTSSSRQGGSVSYSPQKRQLMTPEEVGKINADGKSQCIIVIRDVPKIIENKYDIFSDERFKESKKYSFMDDDGTNLKSFYFGNKQTSISKIQAVRKNINMRIYEMPIEINNSFNSDFGSEKDFMENLDSAIPTETDSGAKW